MTFMHYMQFPPFYTNMFSVKNHVYNCLLVIKKRKVVYKVQLKRIQKNTKFM